MHRVCGAWVPARETDDDDRTCLLRALPLRHSRRIKLHFLSAFSNCGFPRLLLVARDNQPWTRIVFFCGVSAMCITDWETEGTKVNPLVYAMLKKCKKIDASQDPPFSSAEEATADISSHSAPDSPTSRRRLRPTTCSRATAALNTAACR